MADEVFNDILRELKELESYNGRIIDITQKIDVNKLKDMISEKMLEEIRRRITF